MSNSQFGGNDKANESGCLKGGEKWHTTEDIGRLHESCQKHHRRKGATVSRRTPYKVYQRLLAAEVNEMWSRLVLITLLAGAPQKAQDLDEECLAKTLANSCRLQKSAAESLAEMYKELYSIANVENWDERKDEGFRALRVHPWKMEWDGESSWPPDATYGLLGEYAGNPQSR